MFDIQFRIQGNQLCGSAKMPYVPRIGERLYFPDHNNELYRVVDVTYYMPNGTSAPTVLIDMRMEEPTNDGTENT